MDYQKIAKLNDLYWDIEIDIAKLAAKYQIAKKDLVEKRGLLTYDDYVLLHDLLIERVKVLEEINKIDSENTETTTYSENTKTTNNNELRNIIRLDDYRKRK